jgi:hypothetical protein
VANTWQPSALAALLQGLNLNTAVVKAVLIDTGAYTYSSAHDFLDDVPSGARIGTPQTIGSKTFGTVAAGVFDGADIAEPSVTGASAEGLYVYEDTGVEATSHLLIWIDTATGLPVTPNGGNINVAWNASGIGKI